MAKRKKPKRTKMRAIEGDDLKQVKPLLTRAVAEWHPELTKARFALVWVLNLEPDQDGRLVLGKAKRASDCDRELADHDLIVFLNRDAWTDLSEAQRLALIDHELSHFTLVLDEDGDPRKDDRGRLCFRMVKHDLGEFRSVVKRHGCYLSDIEAFAAAIAESKASPLFPRAAQGM